MYEFACHTWAFNDLTLPEALGTIARLGFRYVDIGSGAHFSMTRAATEPDALAAEIRADLAMFNLQVSDLYLMLPRISIADENKRRSELELFRAMLPFAKALGVSGVTVSPGVAHPSDDREALKNTTVALRNMVRWAQRLELDLSIEPHMDSMAQTPDAALRWLHAAPGLKITLDWANMLYQNIAFDDIAPLLPHTRHVQVRQAARDHLQTPFDKGQLDLSGVLRVLRDADYAGVVAVEYLPMTGERHGMMAVNAIRECARLRDALRDARDDMLAET